MLSQEKTPGRTEMHREQPRYTSVFPTETKLDLEKQRETDEPTSEAGNCEFLHESASRRSIVTVINGADVRKRRRDLKQRPSVLRR